MYSNTLIYSKSLNVLGWQLGLLWRIDPISGFSSCLLNLCLPWPYLFNHVVSRGIVASGQGHSMLFNICPPESKTLSARDRISAPLQLTPSCYRSSISIRI
ncbi:hypothetical protein Y032_0511g2741 [Ancylostoma ceylanicum]|uniref:Uncharacterized protein n=1 Tax=Ancylostoma ceylanicum TaxID=53326 RepID=A0A016WUJ2_9BILA|nr:hypothetical protein Y032_0511g2741 [Ancylostoma ceylanicum]